MTFDQLQSELMKQLSQSGLLSVVDTKATQVLDLSSEIWVEIVLTDATKSGETQELVQKFLKSSLTSRPFALMVRSIWKIRETGEPAPAYSPNGGLIAAVLIPVQLISGAKQVTVTVSVTKLAEWEFERILGGKAPLKRIAEVIVTSWLLRGGRSAWNPLTQDYLEVASGGVANISRLLKQAA